ncbi:hypothetical protein ACIBIZ_04505 [Nonomuraea spiralis]|uniref:hypothetical protein n=1 Tax=Nonomuraea TaxID=83681 RepID=UPI000F797EAA|nr:hypothetical protein [Nonomuraea sp. WAC 01424]RSN14156.1 hypothetical protein DMB42_06295 [Nonomuraea sp. WAC 01424]
MEDDHQVWPPASGPRHRRPPPHDSEDDSDEDEEAPWPPRRGRDPYERETAWNPRIRRTVPIDPPAPSEALPPSARLYGTPADPGPLEQAPSRVRRWPGVLVALVAAAGLVAGTRALAPRLTAPPPEPERLSDAAAGVSLLLPPGWSPGTVPPVTGFTSAARDGNGALVMAMGVPGPVTNAKKTTGEAAELYSRLLLKGDKVTVVEDRDIPQGHTRALRAEYQDVVNRPAFLRVMLLTRAGRAVLLVGLLQPEATGGRQALDAVMTSFR